MLTLSFLTFFFVLIWEAKCASVLILTFFYVCTWDTMYDFPLPNILKDLMLFFSIDTLNAPYISRALILSSYWDTTSTDVTAPCLEVSHTFIDVTEYWRYSSRFIPQVLVPIEYSDNIHCDITAFNASQCYHAWFNSVSSMEILSPTKCALKQNSDEEIAIMLCDMYYCAPWLKQTHMTGCMVI